jgi:hypothetical protein
MIRKDRLMTEFLDQDIYLNRVRLALVFPSQFSDTRARNEAFRQAVLDEIGGVLDSVKEGVRKGELENR